ncbi:Uncharacterized protein APZ42_013513 [Daphnia magna]|uniref:Reverse transcriptase domain-containing protein n=1 Tax=Daphnia magna TaxID=35525 RepID=A0A162QT17_9CRUS|nr:Uncharacterized protein APZ42_013513 [Daphnia magna]
MMSIIQLNSRSLTKANLVQFKAHLHKYKPLIAIISETFWKDSFTVKFKSYNVINKNRQNQNGGGVAILIHKSLQFFQFSLPATQTIEAVGASIAVKNNNTDEFIDIISAYIPNGNQCYEDELKLLTQARRSSFILCGDFNAHHGRWETSCNHHNQSGRAIANLLENNEELELATPPDLGTRQNPTTLTYSTIDLALMSPHLALTAEVTKGPHIGSDHLPVHIKINAKPILTLGRAPSWDFKNANWTTWNVKVNEAVNSSEFYSTANPETKYLTFHEALMSATKASNIFLAKPSKKILAEPAQPWWNEDCRKAVAMARKARNAGNPRRGGIICASNIIAWKEKENSKNRIILKAKKIAIKDHINSLSPKSSPAKTWAFVKAWTKGIRAPDLCSSPIKDPETQHLVTLPEEKTRIFALQYDHQKVDIPDRPEFEHAIRSKINASEPNPLNSIITQQELRYGMSNLKSKAMGRDLIHNQMLKNMSQDNKKHLLNLFYAMLTSSYIPDEWKLATIIPIRKPDKPAENPESYRPISLTSCLGKTMEKIVNQRLTWEGFNKRKPINTYAVFLDVAKAFDSTWIQGLLFKLSNRHFEDYPLKVGVPQGSPLSPFLFSVMMDDFPTFPTPGQTLMFADDIEFHIHAENGQKAEELISPYLESISKWSKKWRIKFSAAKSNLVNFNRQKHLQSQPLLFLSGTRIPETEEIKHLGIHLRWAKQTEVAISKSVKLRNLFKILSQAKQGPDMDSLCILYKALVRSKIEYGIIAYGSTCKTRQMKLEVIGETGVMLDVSKVGQINLSLN